MEIKSSIDKHPLFYFQVKLEIVIFKNSVRLWDPRTNLACKAYMSYWAKEKGDCGLGQRMGRQFT